MDFEPEVLRHLRASRRRRAGEELTWLSPPGRDKDLVGRLLRVRAVARRHRRGDPRSHVDSEGRLPQAPGDLGTVHTNMSVEEKLRDRSALYPSFGCLYPEGVRELQEAWNDTAVRAAPEP